jgi:hypothetical protein
VLSHCSLPTKCTPWFVSIIEPYHGGFANINHLPNWSSCITDFEQVPYMVLARFRAMLFQSRAWLQEPFSSIYPSRRHFRPHWCCFYWRPLIEKGQLPLDIESWRFFSFRCIQSNRWAKKILGWKVTQAVLWQGVTPHWVKWANHRKEKLHGELGRPSSFQWSQCSIPSIWHRVTRYHFLVLPPSFHKSRDEISFNGGGL